MRLRLSAVLLALALSLDAVADDRYAQINRLRAGEGPCARAADLPPLRPLEPHAALERVARDLAQGIDLARSLRESGYRASRSRTFSIRGEGAAGTQAAGFLAGQRDCTPFQDAGVSHAGIHLGAREVWIVMAAPFAPSVGMSAQAANERLLELVNQARAAPRNCGDRVFAAARPLAWSGLLADVSQRHAEEMARHNYFSHSGRDGSKPAQRVERAGYRYRATGENIAAGTQMGPDDAVAGWIRSPGHCANLMNPAYTEMGAAFAVNAESDLGVYWTQAFGAPR